MEKPDLKVMMDNILELRNRLERAHAFFETARSEARKADCEYQNALSDYQKATEELKKLLDTNCYGVRR